MGSPVSVTRATTRFRRTSSLLRSKGEPFGESRISAPVSASVSQVSSVQMSSQIGTPRRTPLKEMGPGAGPALNTRFSSNTP